MAGEPISAISPSEAVAKFNEILGDKEQWRALVGSQTNDGLAIFMGWALRAALFRAERVNQEGFLSTAVNRSSVLAGAEDRQYLPRKARASSGIATLHNDAAVNVTLPAEHQLVSDAQVTYTTTDAVIIPAGGVAQVGLSQRQKTAIEHTVTTAKAFYEVTLDAETSARVESLTVEVDTGSGYQPFTYRPRLANTRAGEAVYDEFYSASDQIGVRFGSEYFGAILPVGAKVRLNLWLTDGPTSLVGGAELALIDDGVTANLGAVTVTAYTVIDNGAAREDTEEIRRGALYYQLFQDNVIWGSDYVFFITRNIPGINWIAVWGEEEAEAMDGFSLNHINRIFVSAHAPGRIGLDDEVLALLRGVKELNRRYSWVEPDHRTFTIAITGKVSRVENIDAVKADITAKLLAAYGRDSDPQARASAVRKAAIYKMVKDTGYFGDDDYEVEIAGALATTRLEQMVSIDMAGSTLDIEYK